MDPDKELADLQELAALLTPVVSDIGFGDWTVDPHALTLQGYAALSPNIVGGMDLKWLYGHGLTPDALSQAADRAQTRVSWLNSRHETMCWTRKRIAVLAWDWQSPQAVIGLSNADFPPFGATSPADGRANATKAALLPTLFRAGLRSQEFLRAARKDTPPGAGPARVLAGFLSSGMFDATLTPLLTYAEEPTRGHPLWVSRWHVPPQTSRVVAARYRAGFPRYAFAGFTRSETLAFAALGWEHPDVPTPADLAVLTALRQP